MSIERIAFTSARTPGAESAIEALTKRYGNTPVDEAEVVVALGGDGFMLQAMHNFMHRDIPIYGMNRGTIGFLMNQYSEDDLLERLDINRATLGNFSVPFSSYVDGVENDSDTDVSQELRRPIGSAYHANHYQRGSFADFFLDGGPVSNSNPAPTGLDVETQPFGQGATHFVVDDFSQVTSFIQSALLLQVQR